VHLIIKNDYPDIHAHVRMCGGEWLSPTLIGEYQNTSFSLRGLTTIKTHKLRPEWTKQKAWCIKAPNYHLHKEQKLD